MSLSKWGAEQLRGAAPAEAAQPPPVLPPSPPVTMAAPAAASPVRPAPCGIHEVLRARAEMIPPEIRFPPGLLELAVAYFTAPERIGQRLRKQETIAAIWDQVQQVPEWRQRPRAMVIDLINNHPAFECGKRFVSLRGAAFVSSAHLATWAFAAADVDGDEEATRAEEHARRKRSRSRSYSRSRSCSPPSKRSAAQGNRAPVLTGRPMIVQQAHRFLNAPERQGAWTPMAMVMHAVALAIDLDPSTERREWLLQELKARLTEDALFEVQHNHARLAQLPPGSHNW